MITGTLWHFIYEWSGNNFIVGLFFPVSESTWEHMKLCFFPILLYAPYMNKTLKDKYPSVTASLLCGTLLGTFSIPVIFYTYSGILGRNLMVLDIAAFIASVLTAFFAVYKFSASGRLIPYQLMLKFLVMLLALCFFLFTYHPPDIGIFINPV